MNKHASELPNPVISRRSSAGRVVRFVYGTIVVGLGLFLGWQLIKPMIYTQSYGSVVAPRYVVSTPYTARIVEMLVKPGQSVRKNQVVAVVRSPEIDALRASLLTSVAEQTSKEADLSIRVAVANATLEPAKQRAAAAGDCAAKLDANPGAVTSVFRSQTLRECAQAAADLARLEAELAEVDRQIRAVRQSRQQLEDVKDFVDHAFNDGMQLAPIRGVVANHAVNPGQSVTAGTPIVQVYDPTELSIQWVLDADRLIQPKAGAPVYVLDGNRVMRATVKEIYSISDQAPEGNTIFSRIRSGQLVRIELAPDETYPAYQTDIVVRYNYWRFMDTVVELYVDIMTGLGFWRQQ